MMKRQWRIERIRAIEREYKVAKIAAEDLDRHLRDEPAALAGYMLRYQDFLKYQENLESTYLIRMFSEFESGLREAWTLALGQATQPRMQELIEAFAARRNIADIWKIGVHDVREYRNGLVHEGAREARIIGLGEARGRLCRFFSLLPLDW